VGCLPAAGGKINELEVDVDAGYRYMIGVLSMRLAVTLCKSGLSGSSLVVVKCSQVKSVKCTKNGI